MRSNRIRTMTWALVLLETAALSAATPDRPSPAKASERLRVGAAAADILADDAMVIGGGIAPGRLAGQEGQLRAVAVVFEHTGTKLVIIACDVLMMSRDLLDPVQEEISKRYEIPIAHILINATHTHHAPSTATLHAYQHDEVFCRRVQQAILQAVGDANASLAQGDASFYFWLGEESSVGQNSRLLLEDNTIYWVGPRDDALRPTGPFDPELPVLAFMSGEGEPPTGDRQLKALIFNHSTHTIGTRGPHRSPSFYGLAAQELEQELGGTICFLQGASGSTHNLSVPAGEAVLRIKEAVRDACRRAVQHPVGRLAAIKRPLEYRVRRFDEAREDAAVSAYCRKRLGDGADDVIEVFRRQRRILEPHQGERRTTWVQAMLIGDVAIVGVPAEFFTRLGQDIKRRSPFRYTYVAELANDWIGYLPDRKAFEMGGYQVWTGLHSYAQAGTGEAIVNEAISILTELHRAAGHPQPTSQPTQSQ